MEFVKIPAGEFVMGTGCIPNATPNCIENETPSRLVKITEPFYMGKYEVTQAQWYAVMRSTPWYFTYHKVGTNTEQHPVEQVSWQDAQRFIVRLNEIEKDNGYTYRLPTEAEWEYAARGGTQTEYFFGNSVEKLEEYAWSSGNSDQKTHPVGQLKPNPFGLYDILGNVWEWCEDSWHGNYIGAPVDASARKMHIRYDSSAVLRGSSFKDDVVYCRSAVRNQGQMSNTGTGVGFRVVSVLLD
jgi:eukaryotic-like serine/threonine-protein kinase